MVNVERATQAAAKRCYSFDRRVYDRALEKRQAIGIGFGVNLDSQRTATAAPVTPTSILGTAPAWWVDGSAGTLVNAGSNLASSWADSSGNARDFTFGVGNRPTIVASGLNGKPICMFGPGNSFGSNSFTSPTPGTTLSYIFAIMRSSGPVGNGRFVAFGQTSGQSALYYGSGITDFNGLNGGASAITNNTWYRLEVLRSNNAGDYLQLSGVGSSGSAGNSASTGAGVTLGADFGGGNQQIVDYAEIFQWTGATAPTAPQRAALAAYSLAKWGV